MQRTLAFFYPLIKSGIETFWKGTPQEHSMLTSDGIWHFINPFSMDKNGKMFRDKSFGKEEFVNYEMALMNNGLNSHSKVSVSILSETYLADDIIFEQMLAAKTAEVERIIRKNRELVRAAKNILGRNYIK